MGSPEADPEKCTLFIRISVLLTPIKVDNIATLHTLCVTQGLSKRDPLSCRFFTWKSGTASFEKRSGVVQTQRTPGLMRAQRGGGGGGDEEGARQHENTGSTSWLRGGSSAALQQRGDRMRGYVHHNEHNRG